MIRLSSMGMTCVTSAEAPSMTRHGSGRKSISGSAASSHGLCCPTMPRSIPRSRDTPDTDPPGMVKYLNAPPPPIDTIGPWTIKAVPTETRNRVTVAARREGLTVGQWLERHAPLSALDQIARMRLLRGLCSTSARPSRSSSGGM